ncbi:MAG: glycine--tRNA ligase subunit beta [Acidobacteriota bacterium]
MASEFLLEVRSHELPAGQLAGWLRRLSTRLFEELMSRGLGPKEMITGATPRRVVLCFRGLPEEEAGRRELELGPPVADAWDGAGEPTEALLGFAERVGLALDELGTERTERGEYVSAVRDLPGRPLVDLLTERVPKILAELPRPSDGLLGSEDWLRPVVGLLALLDGEVLPVSLGGHAAGSVTAGHPACSPEPFEVDGWDTYAEALDARHIVVSLEARRQRLVEGLTAAAAELGGTFVPDDDLLERLVARCEIPGVVSGAFGPEYLELPEEIVLATLGQDHGAFGVRRDGELLPHFVTAMDRPDDPEGHVVAGQELAARGHLEDIRFHHLADRRRPLAERARALGTLEVREGWGTYDDKTARLRELVTLACGQLGWGDVEAHALETVGLLDGDLGTGVVGRFPRLRGLVGGVHARGEGYVEPVWQGIYDHRLPLADADGVPRGQVGQVVAVADRLSTLVGHIGFADAPPTASKDPHGQRRAASGLLRVVVEAGLELDLDLLAARAVLLYGEHLERGAADILRDLQALLADRLDQLLGRRGFRWDEIEAAKAVGTANLPDLVARIEALRGVREDPRMLSLVRAAKRISNIVQGVPEHALDGDLLEEPAELDLHRALGSIGAGAEEAAEAREYETCLRHLMELVPTLDRFFADVLVMAEDERLRTNRLALLQSCRRIYWRVARLKALAVS